MPSKTVAEILNEQNFRIIREWISEADDGQLDEYISRTATHTDDRSHKMALAERNRRHFKHLSKPHWTTAPNFWITLAAHCWLHFNGVCCDCGVACDKRMASSRSTRA